MNKEFNAWRFEGLNCRELSNKYLTMDRVSEDGNKIVVKVGSGHLQKTKYGFALILDDKHVCFLKNWQVSENYFGNEVILTKDYFIPKEWGYFSDYEYNDQNLLWNHWLEVAKAQDEFTDDDGTRINIVRWEK